MKNLMTRAPRMLLCALLIALLAGCGGGGNSSGTPLLGSGSSGSSSSSTSSTSSTSASAYTVALASSASSLSTGGIATETATITNSSGTPQVGVPVTFTIGSNLTGATLTSGLTSTGTSTSSVSATTNASGQASVIYTAGASAGTDSVIAQATPSASGGSTAFGSVSIVVSPGTASSNAETIQFIPGTLVTVAPGVHDEFEVKVLNGTTPVVGATVSFSLASNSSGATLNGSASAVSVTTAADGTAYVGYQAGGSSGTTDTVSASVLNSSSVALDTATQQVAISASGASTYFLRLSGTALSTPTETAGTCVATIDANGTPLTQGNSLDCTKLATNVMDPSTARPTINNGVTLTGVVTDASGKPVPNMAVLFSFGSTTTAANLGYCNLTNATGTPSCKDTIGGVTSIGTSDTGGVTAGFDNNQGNLQNTCIAAETDNTGTVTVRYAAGGATGIDTVIASVTPGSAINPVYPQACPTSLSTIYVTESAAMNVSVPTPQP